MDYGPGEEMHDQVSSSCGSTICSGCGIAPAPAYQSPPASAHVQAAALEEAQQGGQQDECVLLTRSCRSAWGAQLPCGALRV